MLLELHEAIIFYARQGGVSWKDKVCQIIDTPGSPAR
jgi:hypothetical protein